MLACDYSRSCAVHAPPVGTREAKLLWTERPKKFLVVKKWHDEAARDGAVLVGDWLVKSYGLEVVTLPDETDEFKMPPRFPRFLQETVADPPSPVCVDEDESDDSSDVDLVVTVGGDGTVLHLSSIFQRAMPPVIALAFGSLGFTTSHSFESFKELIGRIMGPPLTQTPSLPDFADVPRVSGATTIIAADAESASHIGGASIASTPVYSAPIPQAFTTEPVPVSIRMRLRVDIFRAGRDPTRGDEPESSVVVLNELLLERGRSPYMASLNAYIDDELLTTVQADGLLIATQTGSTAYSLSAGGSILSPNTAAIAFTPICPHALSFRPLLLPDSVVIRLEVPRGARSSAWCSFDGRGSRELHVGDFVVVRSSPWPMPLLCRWTSTGDWIKSLKAKLLWNVRDVQKSFFVDAARSQLSGDHDGSERSSEAVH